MHAVRGGGIAMGMSAVLVTSLVACGDRLVEKSTLQSQVKERITMISADQSVGAVKCKDDLKAKVKASTSCMVDIVGSQKQVTVTVNQVDGTTIHYDIIKDDW